MHISHVCPICLKELIFCFGQHVGHLCRRVRVSSGYSDSQPDVSLYLRIEFAHQITELSILASHCAPHQQTVV